MRIAFIGHGNVGGALASRLQEQGHEVVLGLRAGTSESATPLMKVHPKMEAAPMAQAVASAQVVFLAVPFHAVEQALTELGELLVSKTLVDCTNPVGSKLSHGLA